MWKYFFCSSFVQKMSLAERWESLLKKVNKDFGGLNIFEIIFQPLALAIHFPSFPPLLIPQRPLPSQSRLLGPGSTQPFNIALRKWNLARSLLTMVELCPTFYKEIFGETGLYLRQAPLLPWSQPELLFREILHIKEPLVGSLAFFSFWFWTRWVQLKNESEAFPSQAVGLCQQNML